MEYETGAGQETDKREQKGEEEVFGRAVQDVGLGSEREAG